MVANNPTIFNLSSYQILMSQLITTTTCKGQNFFIQIITSMSGMNDDIKVFFCFGEFKICPTDIGLFPKIFRKTTEQSRPRNRKRKKALFNLPMRRDGLKSLN